MSNKMITKTFELNTKIFETTHVGKDFLINETFKKMLFDITSSFPINEEFSGKITQTIMDEDYVIAKADECMNSFDMLGLQYWRSVYDKLTKENLLKLELTFVYKIKND